MGDLIYINRKETTFNYDINKHIYVSESHRKNDFTLGSQLLLDYDLIEDSKLTFHLAVSYQKKVGPVDSKSSLVIIGAGLNPKISNHVKLLTEFINLSLPESPGGNLQLLNFGIRLFWENTAIDLAFVRPLANGASSTLDEFPLGLPFVSFSAKL